MNKKVISAKLCLQCVIMENDKCPPWSLQASGMSHDKQKKTIYYDNAVIKVYDIPIFYFPKISHPDQVLKDVQAFYLLHFLIQRI